MTGEGARLFAEREGGGCASGERTSSQLSVSEPDELGRMIGIRDLFWRVRPAQINCHLRLGRLLHGVLFALLISARRERNHEGPRKGREFDLRGERRRSGSSSTLRTRWPIGVRQHSMLWDRWSGEEEKPTPVATPAIATSVWQARRRTCVQAMVKTSFMAPPSPADGRASRS